MYTVSFTEYVPTPRYDGLHWDTIKIEEGVTEDGPWVLIDTIDIPLDEDPENPQARSFTTHNGTVPAAWYRVSFIDEAGDVLYTDPVQNVPSTIIDYRPTVGDVGRKVMSRTKDKYGNVTGVFSSDTSPTAAQVGLIIDDVLTEVTDVIGDEVPAPLRDDAANVLALRAAMQIELDFFTDQVNTGRSIYPQLHEQYKEALASLQKQVQNFEDGETGVVSSSPATGPSYGFPTDKAWMTRRW